MPLNDSDRFRKEDDVRWQGREATWTTNGSPEGEHNQAHQYPSPQQGNAKPDCHRRYGHERNLWILGYEHALVSSNKTLARTIEEYASVKFSGDRASKRSDLFLAQNLRGGYLLIEFKRPSKESDRQDQRQAQEYRDDLEPKFGQIEILLSARDAM